ncbi:MAG: sensor histidine kinase [Micromonosporaceae bacterium]|nr:sensor histidine kinase [Micromonosporaceae bacterium]
MGAAGPAGPGGTPTDGSLATRCGGLYVAGLLGLMALLVYLSPFYGFQAFAGYVHSVAYLRRSWPVAGVLGTAVLASYAQLGGSWNSLSTAELGGLAALTVINALVGGGFTYFGYFTNQQSERRRQMIAELNEANRRLAESLAENAALHARLMEQAREAGVLDERARLAREIHDTIAQGLAGVVAQLEAAEAAEGDPRLHQRHIDTARTLARETLAEARRSVQALAPARLVGARLPDAIAEMARAWAQTTHVTVHVDATGDVRALLPDLEVTLFRVAQEALANVGKHAKATTAWLTLTYMEDVVVLDVRDDGVGFDPGARPGPGAGTGYGLSAMEQRVLRVSGTFTVESAPGEGTAVSASVPAIPAEAGAVSGPAGPDRTATADTDGTVTADTDRTVTARTRATEDRGTA